MPLSRMMREDVEVLSNSSPRALRSDGGAARVVGSVRAKRAAAWKNDGIEPRLARSCGDIFWDCVKNYGMQKNRVWSMLSKWKKLCKQSTRNTAKKTNRLLDHASRMPVRAHDALDIFCRNSSITSNRKHARYHLLGCCITSTRKTKHSTLKLKWTAQFRPLKLPVRHKVRAPHTTKASQKLASKYQNTYGDRSVVQNA